MVTRKKWLLVFTALMAILIVAACSSDNGGNGGGGTTTTPPATNTPQTGGTTTPSDSDEPSWDPITFTINTAVPTMNWDNPVANVIQERTNVTLKWDILTGDEREKLNVWLAGGDYPDFVTLWDDSKQRYVEANALVELTDLIEEHGPNIKARFNNDLSPLKSADGKIWALRGAPVQEVRPLGEVGWIYLQMEVVKEAGYPDIETLEDVYNVVKAYRDKYPEINGGNTIGFSNFGNANQLYNIFNSAAMYYTGLPHLGVYEVDENKNLSYVWFNEDYTDMFKFFNRMNKEGLFDQESLIQDPDQFGAKCAQGRVLAVFGPTWASGCNSALIANDMPERQYVPFDIIKPGNSKERHVNLRSTDQWVGITKNNEDPVRAIQFYNELFSTDMRILIGWGIEGETYEVIDGVRVPTDYLYDELQKGGDAWERLGMSYSRPLLAPLQGSGILEDNDYARYNSSLGWLMKSITPEIQEFLSHYNAQVPADLAKPITYIDEPVTTVTPPEEVQVFQREAIAAWGQALQKMILEPDESKLDGIWNDFHNQLRSMGLDDILSTMTDLYKEYLANR